MEKEKFDFEKFTKEAIENLQSGKPLTGNGGEITAN